MRGFIERHVPEIQNITLLRGFQGLYPTQETLNLSGALTSSFSDYFGWIQTSPVLSFSRKWAELYLHATSQEVNWETAQ